MGDFGSIMRRGKKVFDMKDAGGKWDRCEECNKRALIYEYIDEEKQTWYLCEECITAFTKKEEE